MTTKNDDIVYIKTKKEYYKLLNVKIIKTFIASSVTKVYGANPVVAGLINFEGKIIPLLNYSKESSPVNNVKVIVVKSEEGIFSICGELIIIKNKNIDFQEIDYKKIFD